MYKHHSERFATGATAAPTGDLLTDFEQDGEAA